LGAIALKKTIRLVSRTTAIAFFALLLVAALSQGAGAVEQVTYTISKAPYWNVGVLSQRLSSACKGQAFNQRWGYRYIIRFNGKEGAGVTGIATKEWNLHDPLNLGETDKTYHFFSDGFSDCKVYVSS
jgi:hypothetical protein